MPWQAPRFGKAPSPRKAWIPSLTATKRIRGRPGMRMRAQVRREEPFCRYCLAKGLYVATDEVDHIVPLAEGGSNARSNHQGLCKPCHDTKSKAERLRGRRDR